MKTIIKELLKFSGVYALIPVLFVYLFGILFELGLRGYAGIIVGHLITFSVLFLLTKFLVFKTPVSRI